MAYAAIELKDSALMLARDGLLLAESPGFALIEDERLIVGEAARSRARLDPRMVNNRFWERLSEAPVLPATDAGYSDADLARAHLSQLWSAAYADVEGLVLAVPGDLDRRRLGLVLGIAAELELPESIMVDSALAACGARHDTGLVVHVGMHLHRSVVTGVELGKRAHRISVASLEGFGSAVMHERFIGLVRDLFVESTRFDPLHKAESEQAIYDRLSGWTEISNARRSIAIEMQAADGRVCRIQMTRRQMIDCIGDFHAALLGAVRECCGERRFALALDADAARVPGLADALLPERRDRVLHLAAGAGAVAASRGAARIFGTLPPNALATSLERDAASTSRTESAGAEPAE